MGQPRRATTSALVLSGNVVVAITGINMVGGFGVLLSFILMMVQTEELMVRSIVDSENE